MKTTYLFLADGFEEVEALTCVDFLRRAAMEVKTVSIKETLQVTGAHGIEVKADITFSEGEFSGESEWLILPGGMPEQRTLQHTASCASCSSRSTPVADVLLPFAHRRLWCLHRWVYCEEKRRYAIRVLKL